MELLVDFAGKVFGVEDIFADMLIPRMDHFQVLNRLYAHAIISFPRSFLAVNHHNNKN